MTYCILCSHKKIMINAMTDFYIVNFHFIFDGDVPRRPSYGVHVSQLKRFASVCSHVEDFNARNKCLTVRVSVS